MHHVHTIPERTHAPLFSEIVDIPRCTATICYLIFCVCFALREKYFLSFHFVKSIERRRKNCIARILRCSRRYNAFFLHSYRQTTRQWPLSCAFRLIFCVTLHKISFWKFSTQTFCSFCSMLCSLMATKMKCNGN